MRNFSIEVGRPGIEALYCKKYAIKEIAAVYGISPSYLYRCLKILYGHDWKSRLTKKKNNAKGIDYYEKQRICTVG